jgi:GMP synthase-like glutamine amidotransferase
MVRLLGIQFRTNETARAHEQVSLRRELGPAVTIDFVSALDAHPLWLGEESLYPRYHGVVLGGSGDLDFDGRRDQNDPARLLSYQLLERLRPFFHTLFTHDIPTLGICYGHQILGAFAGARVHHDPEQAKTRSHPVRFLINHTEYFIFSDLPATFHAHYGHKDVLDQIPPGATLILDGGAACRVSGLQYGKNIYTVQFHPELTRRDITERIRLSSRTLPEGVIAQEIFSDDPNSHRIVQNFGRCVAALAEARGWLT